MPTGIVKWFNDQKGYGFITPEGGGKDLFCHYSDVQGSGFKSLVENEPVSFEVVQTDRGAKAQKIVRLLASPAK